MKKQTISNSTEFKGMSFTPKQIGSMRDWISDCTWTDLDDPEDIADLSNHEILQGVEKHYSGGLEQFLSDNEG